MNQKDYKEIAGIIRSPIEVGKDTDTTYLIYHYSLTAKHLADYFEKEDKEDLNKTEERFKEYKKKNESFNKKQFLKDCGVK